MDFELFDGCLRPNAAFGDFLEATKIPGETLREVNLALQARFIEKNRDGTPKESWDCEGGDEFDLIRLWFKLRSIGIVDAVKPAPGKYQGALVLGGLFPSIDPRYKALSDISDEVELSGISLLGSLRPLQFTIPTASSRPGPESLKKIMSPSELLQIRDNWPWPQKGPATEIDMMQLRWEMVHLPQRLRNLPVQPVFLSAPRVSRKAWLSGGVISKWLSTAQDGGHYLLVSQMPYAPVEYMAVLNKIRAAERNIRLSTVCCGAVRAPIDVYMREITDWVHGLFNYHFTEDVIERARRLV